MFCYLTQKRASDFVLPPSRKGRLQSQPLRSRMKWEAPGAPGAKGRKTFRRTEIFFAAQAAKQGLGKALPNKFPARGKNRRIADFGTVVETCSKTAADCPCPGFSVHRANGAGLSARCARSFFLSPKIHLKGRQLPAVRGFFKFSFALVIRETGFWQPAGQRIFPFTPYNTSKGKNDGNTGNFLFAS